MNAGRPANSFPNICSDQPFLCWQKRSFAVVREIEQRGGGRIGRYRSGFPPVTSTRKKLVVDHTSGSFYPELYDPVGERDTLNTAHKFCSTRVPAHAKKAGGIYTSLAQAKVEPIT
jgi:hypothetical protein